MKRRDFFGLAVAALVAPLALSAEPKLRYVRQYKCDAPFELWRIPEGWIRECKQYQIVGDNVYHYDVLANGPDCSEAQIHVYTDFPDPESARFALESYFRTNNLMAIAPGSGWYFRLALPPTIPARYV